MLPNSFRVQALRESSEEEFRRRCELEKALREAASLFKRELYEKNEELSALQCDVAAMHAWHARRAHAEPITNARGNRDPDMLPPALGSIPHNVSHNVPHNESRVEGRHSAMYSSFSPMSPQRAGWGNGGGMHAERPDTAVYAPTQSAQQQREYTQQRSPSRGALAQRRHHAPYDAALAAELPASPGSDHQQQRRYMTQASAPAGDRSVSPRAATAYSYTQVRLFGHHGHRCLDIMACRLSMIIP